MSNTELEQNLLRQLRGGGNEQNVQKALVAVLKGGASQEQTREAAEAKIQYDMAQCGANSPAAAAECVALLAKCVGTESTAAQQIECMESFTALKDKIRTGIIFKNGDISKVKQLLGGLGIDYTKENAVGNWMNGLAAINTVAATEIKNNTELRTILETFVVQVNNPTLVPGSTEQQAAMAKPLKTWNGVPGKETTLVKKVLQMKNIPFKKTRLELAREVAIQAGGGYSSKSSASFVRLMDSMDSIINMRGGGNGIELYEQLASTYDNFVEKLKGQGKQIDTEDDKKIRGLLADLENNENKLNTLVKYILTYNKLRADPKFADELKSNTVTQEILADLYSRKKELEEKYAVKAKNVKSIIETVYQALQGNNPNGERVQPSQIGSNLHNAMRGLYN